MLSELSLAVSRSTDEPGASGLIKAYRAQIDILILCANTPVIGERVLQTAADHPSEIVVTFFTGGKINAIWWNVVKSGLVIDVAPSKTTGHIR